MFTSLTRIVATTGVLAEMEVRKLLHDPLELVTRGIQPLLWLGIFGQALSHLSTIPTEGGATYLQYIAPGILAQSVTFISIFFGLSVIWERDLGLLQKFLVTPSPRIALVWGKMIAAGIRGLCQAIIIFLFCFVLGIPLIFLPLNLLLVALIVLLGAGFYTGVSMIVASIVKTRERFMGIGQVVTLPLFFASNAIYPISIMPPWLQFVAKVNPLSYMVNGLRGLLVTGSLSQLAEDFLILGAITLGVSIVSAAMYPRILD